MGERPLRVGVVVRPAPTLASPVAHSPALALLDFCRSLAQATRLDAEPRTFQSYTDLLQAIVEGELHLAWLPPLPAIRAINAAAFIPLAVPIRGGSTSYGSALFTRPASPIRHVIELDVARAGWV